MALDIEARLAAIDAPEGDPEVAHGLEDDLMRDLLRSAAAALRMTGPERSACRLEIRRFIEWDEDPTADRTRWGA